MWALFTPDHLVTKRSVVKNRLLWTKFQSITQKSCSCTQILTSGRRANLRPPTQNSGRYQLSEQARQIKGKIKILPLNRINSLVKETLTKYANIIALATDIGLFDGNLISATWHYGPTHAVRVSRVRCATCDVKKSAGDARREVYGSSRR